MEIITITKHNFEEEVMNSEVPVLLDFWAAWCGPCKIVSPVIDEIAKEADSVKVGKINVDEQPELASAFNITGIPTILVIKDKKVAATRVGVAPKEQILEMIRQ